MEYSTMKDWILSPIIKWDKDKCSYHFCLIFTGDSSHGNWEEKGNKEEGLELLLFIENSKKFTKKLLELKSKFSKAENIRSTYKT